MNQHPPGRWDTGRAFLTPHAAEPAEQPAQVLEAVAGPATWLQVLVALASIMILVCGTVFLYIVYNVYVALGELQQQLTELGSAFGGGL